MKSKARNPKAETNPKSERIKSQTASLFRISNFRALNLFRIALPWTSGADFGFRIFLLALCPALARAVSTPQPAVPGDWQLSYDDEFNDNTATDLAGWTYDIGNGQSEGIAGWGNSELEYYTNSSSNVNVANGSLNISAIKQSTDGYAYSSGRIRTTGLFDQTYGCIEFRAELPSGTGLWPAVWMLPQNSTYGGWPTSGEADILESTGQSPTLVQGSLHTGSSSSTQYTQTQTFSGSGLEPAKFTTATWHTYDLVWDNGDNGNAGVFKWYVDGTLYETQTDWYAPSSSNKESPFNEPFYLLINLAVGGTYGGTPNLMTNTPYTMSLDYVRAYSNLLGDTNADGVVNATDLATIKANLGKKMPGGYTVGDFNGDGIVNDDDLSLYELGLAEQSVTLGATPEPGMLGFLLIPLLGMRRRSHV